MIRQFACLSLLILVGLTALPAQATTITTYTDKATFLTHTGAASATGALPNLGEIPGGSGASQTIGSVTFTITAPSVALYIGVPSGLSWSDWTPLLPGNEISVGGIKNLNAALASPVFAFGFDVVEPSTGDHDCAPCVDTTFNVTLKNSGATVGTFTFNAPDDVAAFVGVQSSSAFDRVEISEIGTLNDNEYFGQVYTAATLVQNPEPSTVLLMGAGALLLWGRYRKTTV
jgi:hypothetical protein